MIVASGPIDEAAILILKPYGDIVIAPSPKEECMLPLVREAVGLVIRGGGTASGAMIRAAPRLKVIGRSGVGHETVDVRTATEHRIPVIYTPGMGARAVAEASVAYMFALVKDLVAWDKRVKQGDWQSRFTARPGDLFGATLGIVGLGSIGQYLSRLVKSFEMEVIAYDPYVTEERAVGLGVTLTSLDDLLSRSDFISIHAPLTPETAGLINRDRLRHVKRGAYLINLSRGGTIENLDILQEALEDGRLAGVGLDVFEPEPPDIRHPLFSMPNCLMSPHVLGTSHGAMREIFISMSQDMAAVFEGRRPRHVVNPEVLDHPSQQHRQLAEPHRNGNGLSPADGLNIENFEELEAYLKHRMPSREGVLFLRKMPGGVSNRTIWAEWPNGEALVLKQALPRLRVDMDWFSDPLRIRREALALRCLVELAPPGAITPLIFEDQKHNLLAMRAVPLPHQNWKDELLAGRLRFSYAEQFGSLLGCIHRNSARQLKKLPSVFADTKFFESLRLEPYYGFTAQQVPHAAEYLTRLIRETRGVHLALVHGDYSPKNILIHEEQLVLVDHEVVHFGDPAFDVGFALAHLLSKANHMAERRQAFTEAAMIFWTSYRLALGESMAWADLESRSARHALGCLLARVAGRSPLEYLGEEAKLRQKNAVQALLGAPPATVSGLVTAFASRLDAYAVN